MKQEGNLRFIKDVDDYRFFLDIRKPKRCRDCGYYRFRKGCIAGKGNCLYIKKRKLSPQEIKCRDCSYSSMDRPCVSATCYQDLMRAFNLRRKAAANGA